MADMVLNASIFLVTFAIVVFRFFRRDRRWDIQRGKYALRFFTSQSNILCAAAALLMCFFPQNRFVWLLKYTGTAAVTVTMLTVFLFLAPSIGKGGLRQLLKGSDLFLHLIAPLLALVSFCVFEKRGMSFALSLAGMLPVVLYGPWYLYKILYAPEEKRWDDFYGFNKGGRWPVTFAMMTVGTFLICMGLLALQNR
ncbi:MAG: hypothetical protein IKQ45_04465 [Clostridia bacterium]|nr:hypothetical protein [Clostridia bacterium]